MYFLSIGILIIFSFILNLHFIQVSAEPYAKDPSFKIDLIFTGNFKPSNMEFLKQNDFLILSIDQGKIFRVINNVLIDKPLLDVNVGTSSNRGLLGIVSSNPTHNGLYVFIYYTESNKDGDDEDKNIPPIGNRLYRYHLSDNKLIEPKLLLDLPVLPGPRHNGGILDIGPDANIYLTFGDVDGTFKGSAFETLAQNYPLGKFPDGRGSIIYLTQNGTTVSDKGILGNLGILAYYYAYGIRNSYGIDWDPITNYLWDTENGPNYGDEINLVRPGFNSGWAKVQGFWAPKQEDIGMEFKDYNKLVNFTGNGIYREPEFVWLKPVAPTAIKFFTSENFGEDYKNDIFVSDANTGSIYHFDLDQERTHLKLSGLLSDKIANNYDELNNVIFAGGFARITDMEVGPDGNLYVLSTENNKTFLYKIIKQ